MTPEERQLITGLFDRMRSYGAPEKDREAEALIISTCAPCRMRLHAGAVGAGAGAGAGSRQRAIQELEERVRELEQGTQPQQGSGSFLGGLFGGTRPDAERRPSSSVPVIGSRAGASHPCRRAERRLRPKCSNRPAAASCVRP